MPPPPVHLLGQPEAPSRTARGAGARRAQRCCSLDLWTAVQTCLCTEPLSLGRLCLQENCQAYSQAAFS